ncbi:hypothetical protein HDV00_011607 [Rhizophlyctis rosea]|nr:hypothetical protein HDV00_011607 [Rhizophlyctis rosea]
MPKTEREARQDRGTSKLGTYLLQGWVMLEEGCSTPGCNLPLMRTKDRSRTICVLCNDPNGPDLPPPEEPEPEPTPVEDNSDIQSEPEVLGTDVEADSAVGDVESLENERRREQANLATRLLGQRMLAGWALLGEICRNSTCYGVSICSCDNVRPTCKFTRQLQIPLVRNKQKRKQCVICQTWYDNEVEGGVEAGEQETVSTVGSSSASVAVSDRPKGKNVTGDEKPAPTPRKAPPTTERDVQQPDNETTVDPAHQEKKRKIDTAPPAPAFIPLASNEVASPSGTRTEIDQTITVLLTQMATLRHSLDQPRQ